MTHNDQHIRGQQAIPSQSKQHRRARTYKSLQREISKCVLLYQMIYHRSSTSIRNHFVVLIVYFMRFCKFVFAKLAAQYFLSICTCVVASFRLFFGDLNTGKAGDKVKVASYVIKFEKSHLI